MARNRNKTVRLPLFGLIIAILFTLVCMLLLAVALIYLHLPDDRLSLLNQIVKVGAVTLGTCFAVPRGGEKGLATGTLLALLYSTLGYLLYILLGGGEFALRCLLGEMLLAWATGAVTGAIRANLPQRKRQKDRIAK